MKTAIYMRVSTEDQSTDMQRSDLIRYCEMHQLEYVIFEDNASGRSTKKRPGLNEMMDRVRRSEFDTVLVWKLDRFSRNMRDFLELHAEMERFGVKFVSFKDHLDFSTPVGRMIAQILAVFAEFESGMTSVRTKAAMAEAKKKGAKFGVKPLDFPLNLALDLKKKGLTYTEIARSLGVGRTTVCKHLKTVKTVDRRIYS